MNATVVSLNRHKERVNLTEAIMDRKRLFLSLLESERMASQKISFQKRIGSIISRLTHKAPTPEALVYELSNKEFAVLRSIMDDEYSLSGYNNFSKTEKKSFLHTCSLIFDQGGMLDTNAYIVYCDRKHKEYENHNFKDA